MRGIQSHGSKVGQGTAGQRLAVNLQGMEHTEVHRGEISWFPGGSTGPPASVDVRLNYLASAPRELKHRATLRLHSATYEVPAKVILIDRDALSPGRAPMCSCAWQSRSCCCPATHSCFAPIRPRPLWAAARSSTPCPPRRRRRSAEALELLEAIEKGEDTEKIRLLVAASLLSGLSLEEIVNRTGMSVKRIEAALATLLSAGELVQAVKEPRIFLSRAGLCRPQGTSFSGTASAS